ncbi:Predicted metal-dependent phosphohydrolase, HD superfamily [Arachidicoccus rhizosphaerae]|uniref:Predicted metal-dependent phosphohydrolase, HD superfamily n=1 Tax=Arachidicoccus rhizosphaerae TaxID=551991 RepID=A0A1H3WWB9_9BACT|nr:Pycsar system effector family protein [Arachidicoccus rhizosphaerae]SDZ91456.1 Predicted metal-dependent phosphohydrolase, HD superfamily [Arachidicoccus rhizosphaerae]
MKEAVVQLVQEAQVFVRAFFANHEQEKRAYHNLAHTQAVVAAAEEISSHYQLEDADYEVVMVAAWFHDVGYHIDPDQHEQAGADAAAAFLEAHAVAPGLTDQVKGCILATKIPQQPKGLLEAIVCDADLFHLGRDRFKEINGLMCQEKAKVLGKELSRQQWRLGTIAFLESHHYHTDYCRMLLTDKKAANLAALKKKAAEVASRQSGAEETKDAVLPESEQGPALPATAASLADTGHEKQEKKKNKDKEKLKEKKEKNERPDKGIETMFRVTAGNNQKLSNMADNKAHILISVNSIILSAVISLLLRKLDAHEELIIPTFILITISLITIIFSILSTRPTIPRGTFTEKDIEEKKTNLLFFGNFYKMNLEQYTKGMWQVMDDRDFLYGSLIKDVYAQGVVLGKKYRLLRTAYNVFMYGLILSVIAYMIGVMVS